jgi:hypothetical protein
MTQVRTYNLDGSLGSDAALYEDEHAQLWLDGELVVAVSLWGAKVALTLTTRLVLLSVDDYGKSTKYGSLIVAPADEASA